MTNLCYAIFRPVSKTRNLLDIFDLIEETDTQPTLYPVHPLAPWECMPIGIDQCL